jgi:hypothetical protein
MSDEVIRARVTSEEKAAMTAAAERERLSLSAWLRRLALSAAGHLTPVASEPHVVSAGGTAEDAAYWSARQARPVAEPVEPVLNRRVAERVPVGENIVVVDRAKPTPSIRQMAAAVRGKDAVEPPPKPTPTKPPTKAAPAAADVEWVRTKAGWVPKGAAR